ncbi:MAG TPA: CotH kinase family protein, partial [Methylomirabilota bacterium]|nr:CotH kinase family protein [Methylomirabilota bacterium]
VNRVPNRSPKHSFRLLFKEQYGATKLKYQVFADSTVKKFDTLVLRADYNNSWIHWDPQARPRAQRTRDAWMKDSHRAMGWVAAHNRYFHLFLNGLYWGVYDFTERPDANFAAAYFGGKSEDYDVVNEFQAKGGTLDAFHALNSLRGLARDPQYQKLGQLLDVTNYIDYVLLNYYAGNQDWGENKNWYAVRRRVPAAPFQYVMWDGEQVLQDVQDDTVSDPYEMPFRLAEELKRNAEFRLAFADRVQKHFFHDGALAPTACAERWAKRAKEVDAAMVAESARWGYYRRNPPFTRDKEWLAEQQRLLKNYFPQRTAIVLQQLRAVGLYPKIAAPILGQQDGASDRAFQVEVTPAKGSRIYYTTNGSDPRVAFTGAITSHAQIYTKAIFFPAGTHVRARTLQDGIWSALTETTFTSASPAAKN